MNPDKNQPTEGVAEISVYDRHPHLERDIQSRLKTAMLDYHKINPEFIEYCAEESQRMAVGGNGDRFEILDRAVGLIVNKDVQQEWLEKS